MTDTVIEKWDSQYNFPSVVEQWQNAKNDNGLPESKISVWQGRVSEAGSETSAVKSVYLFANSKLVMVR